VKVLAVVHGSDAPPGSFGEVVRERGHSIATWKIDSQPAPDGDFDAVMVFGGAMHADQEDRHPWLVDEDAFICDLLERRVPLLGVCLGAQLLAKAAGARVYPASEPEVGWVDVERTADAAEDPLLSGLPARFSAFQWHLYAFDVPVGASELARSRVCSQAFRLGDAAWGVQFHPEVTREVVARWVDETPDELPVSTDEFLAGVDSRIEEWERLGRSLCGAFVAAAERSALVRSVS
jgi:GMP synthase-like glutamine amidotransferase